MFLPLIKSSIGLILYCVVVGLVDGCYVVLLPLLTSRFLGADRAPLAWGCVVSVASISFMAGPSFSGKLRICLVCKCSE